MTRDKRDEVHIDHNFSDMVEMAMAMRRLTVL